MRQELGFDAAGGFGGLRGDAALGQFVLDALLFERVAAEHGKRARKLSDLVGAVSEGYLASHVAVRHKAHGLGDAGHRARNPAADEERRKQSEAERQEHDAKLDEEVPG